MKKVKIAIIVGLVFISALVITGCEAKEAIPFLELLLSFLYII